MIIPYVVKDYNSQLIKKKKKKMIKTVEARKDILKKRRKIKNKII